MSEVTDGVRRALDSQTLRLGFSQICFRVWGQHRDTHACFILIDLHHLPSPLTLTQPLTISFMPPGVLMHR